MGFWLFVLGSVQKESNQEVTDGTVLWVRGMGGASCFQER